MPERFSIEEHEKRMRDLLKPKPKTAAVAGVDLLGKLREIATKRKSGVTTPPPAVPEV